MHAFLAVAVLFAGAAVSSAAELYDFSKPQNFPVQNHGGWKSYEIYKERSLSVHLIHIDPGIARNPYRLKADSISVVLHVESFAAPKPSSATWRHDRGDIIDWRAGDVSVGLAAGSEGFDKLFITRSIDMPTELKRGDSAAATGRAARTGHVVKYAIARSRVDKLSGPARLVSILKDSGLKVDLLRLSGTVTLNNPSTSSWVIFPLEGMARVRTTGAEVQLSKDRVFIAAPGALVHLGAPRDKPAYLYLITPSK